MRRKGTVGKVSTMSTAVKRSNNQLTDLTQDVKTGLLLVVSEERFPRSEHGLQSSRSLQEK